MARMSTFRGDASRNMSDPSKLSYRVSMASQMRQSTQYWKKGVFNDSDSEYSSKSQADRGKSLKAIIRKYHLDHRDHGRQDEISYVKLQQEVSLSEYEKNEYACQMRKLKPLKVKNRHFLENIKKDL